MQSDFVECLIIVCLLASSLLFKFDAGNLKNLGLVEEVRIRSL